MTDTRPIIYLLDGSRAVTGALVAASAAARALASSARVVLVIPEDTVVPEEHASAFCRIEHQPVAQLSRKFSELLVFVPRLISNSWWLRRAMAREGATILLINDFYLMQGACLRLLGFRGHILQWVRCDPFSYAGIAARPLLWCAANTASRIVVVSRYVKQLLSPSMATTLLYDAFTSKASTGNSSGVSSGRTFLYIGNYIPGKGQDVAIAAFAIAAKELPDLQLAFHGGDMGIAQNRNYVAALKNQVKALGLASRIQFHGFAESPQALMQHAYAALNFSQSESFSMTVLEASGAGLPVIATDSGGPGEILVDGVTGILVPVGDVAAAASAMLTLTNNPVLAQQMGAAGAKYVSEHFSPKAFTAALHALLF